MNIKELKNKAKKSLKGKYKDAIAILIATFGMNFIATIAINFLGLNENLTQFINSVSSTIINGVVGFGIVNFYLKISRNEQTSYEEMFSKTKMMWFYILLSLLTGLFIALWSILFIIPGIIAAMSYSLIFYIKLDNPELSLIEVIGKSKKMMQGHKWEFFVLNLSFLGWEILGIFTLGILYFWLFPYMEVTCANFYNNIKEIENNN